MKTYSGMPTCKCHLEQSAVVVKILSSQSDAAPESPSLYKKKKNDPGFFSNAISSIGMVISGDTNDYVPSDTRCKDGFAYITDRPGIWHNFSDSMSGRIDYYSFLGYAWVSEAPSINGSIFMDISYNWDVQNFGSKWSANSTDGNINEGN